MRGKVCGRDSFSGFVRITPAYAGKSYLKEYKMKFDEDHPRLCGEKFKSLAAAYGGLGSPPPMRGKETR